MPRLIPLRLVPLLVTLALGACAPGTPRDDAPTAAELRSPPAVVRDDDPHTGPYFAGAALAGGPVPPIREVAAVHDIRIDVVHRVIELAPGVPFSAWTFGGQVPGPVARVRVGERVRFSMTNRSEDTMPGRPVFAAPMMHSMDFHAAMVSPQDKYRSIAPGQTISFEFTPHYPGVFMYHCGTPMILEHIASGMYGMVIVEPRGGWPTRVDREYCVVQSEFYTRPDPAGRRVDGRVLQVLDGERLRAKQSSYTVFNGAYNGMVDHPLPARPGERVRLYVLNAGPSNTSSFHVVGTIFDRVWLDGNPFNELHGMQTVLLPSSGSAVVEFVIPEAGKYVMVDHHFANASQGAIGVIDASGGTPEGPLEHHNIPATAAPDDPEAVVGQQRFESTCLACHGIGTGDKLGPDLAGVTTRRTDAWLRAWLASPTTMLATDDTAKALLARYRVPMPDQGLDARAIDQLLRYFHWTATASPAATHAHE
jgi:nitrite reductase (NO-forming)